MSALPFNKSAKHQHRRYLKEGSCLCMVGIFGSGQEFLIDKVTFCQHHSSQSWMSNTHTLSYRCKDYNNQTNWYHSPSSASLQERCNHRVQLARSAFRDLQSAGQNGTPPHGQPRYLHSKHPTLSEFKPHSAFCKAFKKLIILCWAYCCS